MTIYSDTSIDQKLHQLMTTSPLTKFRKVSIKQLRQVSGMVCQQGMLIPLDTLPVPYLLVCVLLDKTYFTQTCRHDFRSFGVIMCSYFTSRFASSTNRKAPSKIAYVANTDKFKGSLIKDQAKRFSKIYTRPVSFHSPMQTKKVYFNPYTYAKAMKNP